MECVVEQEKSPTRFTAFGGSLRTVFDDVHLAGADTRLGLSGVPRTRLAFPLDA